MAAFGVTTEAVADINRFGYCDSLRLNLHGK